MRLLLKEHSIKSYTVGNRQPARAATPQYLDAQSGAILAGEPLPGPVVVAPHYDSGAHHYKYPLLLRPFGAVIRVQMQACKWYDEGRLDLSLYAIQSDILLDGPTDLSALLPQVGTEPTDWSDWGGVPWVGTGGYSGGSDDLTLAVTPENGWRLVEVRVKRVETSKRFRANMRAMRAIQYSTAGEVSP
jgi:hypothetical protein